MARKRFVTSAMGTDEHIERIAETDQLSAMMWPWLLTAFDDWGRLDVTSVGKVRLEIFAAFPKIKTATVTKAIDAYASSGLVHRYAIGDREYLAIRPHRWMKWQTYLNGTKRASAKPQNPDPVGAPWPASEDQQLIVWMTRAEDREKIGDVGKCLPTSTDNPRHSDLSVPSPSPSPSPSLSYEALAHSAAPKRDLLALFAEFYAEYPKKKSKGTAEKAWKTLNPDDATFKAIMTGLKAAKTSREWARENGQFIPYPATWLRAKGWLDENAGPIRPSPEPRIWRGYGPEGGIEDDAI